ncbi:MAG: multicopper oxidase domain-containing protein [Myxococcales bacterium]|nr:multicopper oxidase domain-containing protein [Myxococcales bacterium]
MLFAFLFAPALATATTCPATNVITDNQAFNWTYHPADANNPQPYYSGTMEMGEASLSIGGYSLTTRAYRQAGGQYSIPGPTLKMKPGEKYVLSFHNTLPYEMPSPEHNVYKDPNISNIHTHGLHISGQSPGDDVTRSFEGGYGGDFVYDMPADHMGGTFWYHAHHHGSTYLQVSGGAFGLLVVDDSADQIPANVAAMEERELVIAYLDTGAAGTGGDSLLSGNLPSTWTVNGKIAGNFCMPPNTWQHWRVLLADRNAMEKTVTVGANCEVKLLARDGVWRTTAPKTLTTNGLSLTGASRADFAVRCQGDSTLSVNNTVVANVYVDGSADTAPNPYAADGVSSWSAARPSYLRDLRNETNVNTESVQMGARTVNGSKFDHMTPTFSLAPTHVQEWSVNGAARHPFHLHVYHVQSLNCGGDFEDGEYYDVVASNCSIRFDLNAATSTPYYGRTIMHCHILAHEDQGAMGWLQVTGGTGAPTFPADGNVPAYGAYYAFGGGTTPTAPNAPSNLAAAAVSAAQIDLSWTDNSGDEQGFEIYRSSDGQSFNLLDTVGADITSYSDTASLSPSSTYWYHVVAYNGAGSSDLSNTASATTQAGGTPTAVTVGSISVSTYGAGQGKKGGRAVIVVRDDQGGLVEGAIVSGAFSGSFTESATSSATDASGSTTVDTTATAKGNVAVTFCVTSISHASLTNFSGSICASL